MTFLCLYEIANFIVLYPTKTTKKIPASSLLYRANTLI
jgi:hypothetical protein